MYIHKTILILIMKFVSECALKLALIKIFTNFSDNEWNATL